MIQKHGSLMGRISGIAEFSQAAWSLVEGRDSNYTEQARVRGRSSGFLRGLEPGVATGRSGARCSLWS